MRKYLNFMALAMTVIVLLGLVISSNPVKAEEDAGEHSVVTDMRGVNRYHHYYYPASKAMFAIPDKFEVRFDVHNGMFFELYYREFFPHGEMDQFRGQSGDYNLLHTKINVDFYTPRGEYVGGYHTIQPNIIYSIPQTKRSWESDRLQVKISNQGSRATREVRMLVMDAGSDTIRATPIPGVYREP